MENNKTKKEIILDAALTLFSERGFDGVGVDEIAKAVGMKGPALYHYFKGKDALLDALFEYKGAYYDQGFGNGKQGANLPESMDELIEMSMNRLKFTIHDDEIKKMRRVLMMEQFRNKKIGEMATFHHLTFVEKMNTVFFNHLIQLGKVKDFDPAVLAFEFTAPVTLLIHMVDRSPEREKEALARIRLHMDHFKKVYGVEEMK